MTHQAIDRPFRPSGLPALAVVILAAHAATTLLLGANPAGAAASNLLQVAAGVTTALACLVTARRATGLGRRFWTLISVAFWIWSAAQATYAYQEVWARVAVPRPSWTHFLFRLYGAPLLIALIIGHEEEERRGPDWQFVLDCAQVGILFLFFYFDLYFVPGGDWQGLTGLSVWGFVLLSDVENWSLFAAFLARSRLSRRTEDRALSGRLVPYLLCYAVSSSVNNYLFAFSNPRTGEWPDLVFTLSLTVGSLLAITWSADRGAPQSEGATTAVNWIPATLPLATLALALPMARKEPVAAFAAIFGSIACFGARLIIMLYRRQRLMEALKASESRYASLLRLAPDAIFVHANGRFTFANLAAARMLGFDSPEELVGLQVLDFVPPEEREALARQIAVDRQTNDSTARRLVCMRRDGVRVPIDALGTAVVRPAGESGLSARLVIARDMTERGRAEAEREALIRELEARNAELERFTYTVSHDLRSPLITITGFLGHVEQAGERGDLAAMRSDLARIRGAASRMDRLLSDLLELSRVGHVLGSSEPVSFDSVCREAIDLVDGRLMSVGVAVEIQPDLPMVYGDRGRLVEVVQNVLDNAAKFMGDQKAPRIEVGARRGEDGTVLFVRDNGIGIHPRHHARIFRLFDRLDPRIEGTGVGLALVKRIIELHGGRIWVESEGDGRGSTLCFTLPGSPDPVAEDATKGSE